MSLLLLDSSAHEVTIYRKPRHGLMFPFEMEAYEYDAGREKERFNRWKAQRYVTEHCGKGTVMPNY